MAEFDVDTALKSMVAAAAAVLQKKWPQVESFAKTEFEKIAETVVSIGEGMAAGTITQDQAPIFSTCRRTPRAPCWLRWKA